MLEDAVKISTIGSHGRAFDREPTCHIDFEELLDSFYLKLARHVDDRMSEQERLLMIIQRNLGDSHNGQASRTELYAARTSPDLPCQPVCPEPPIDKVWPLDLTRHRFSLKLQDRDAALIRRLSCIASSELVSTRMVRPAGVADRVLRATKSGMVVEEHGGSNGHMAGLKRRWVMDGSEAMKKMVSSNYFEMMVLGVITANVIIVGWEADWVAHNPKKGVPSSFLFIGIVYTVVAVAEVAVRIGAEGLNFFWSRDWIWNYFDFLVAISSIVDSSLSIIEDTAGGGNVLSASRVIRIIRVNRVLRTFRLVRMVRFMSALRTLVYSIICTLKSLIWALLLLLMIFYGFGVAFTQARSDHLANVQDGAVIDDKLNFYWGSVIASMLTLFMSISGGVSWQDAILPLHHISAFWTILFIIFISFVIFAVLNVVTGVFCNSAINEAERDKHLAAMQVMARRDEFVHSITKLFEDIDSDHSGTITLTEFEKFLGHEWFLAYFSSLDIDTSDVLTLFKLLDKDGTGVIDVKEFVDGCLQLKGNAKAIHMAKVMHDSASARAFLENAMCEVQQQMRSLIRMTNNSQPHQRAKLFSV